MNRILLLSADSAVEDQIVELLTERMRAQYLLRVESLDILEIPSINERPPDVVLVDLPAVGGGEVLDRQLAIALPVPVIALTSVDDTEAEAFALRRGAQDCLLLPELTSRALVRAIRHAIERAAVERRLEREQEMLSSLLDQLPIGSISKTFRAGFCE